MIKMDSFTMLERIVESKRLSHAYIFSGSDNEILKKASQRFSELLEVKNEDIIRIDSGGEEIKIKEIRELKKRLGQSPFFSPYKVAIISKAEKMNAESANALLKILEEPRGKAVIVLLTSMPQSLLLTILSRCQIINFFIQESEANFSICYDYEYLEELSKADKATILEALNNWLLAFRRKFLENKDPKLIPFLKKLIITSFNLKTTNINPRLALEALILDLS